MVIAAPWLDVESPQPHQLARDSREPGGLGLRYKPFLKEP